MASRNAQVWAPQERSTLIYNANLVTDLNAQRPLISGYQELQDTAVLLREQRTETKRLLASLSRRRAALLSSPRHRQEYIPEQTLTEISDTVDLDADERAPKDPASNFRDVWISMNLREV
ncbi:unnamed protein product [Zymoseptoria tritici ST99CH_1A5]|uniref:Uncharacterized protein n=2 Tax=Zymoseptoria tritici TaxID=1047171 RepID=F9XQU8_ZYMTI|nr:uncharacterized protein MYCGRDRAFT_83119 [Zymoseptoria tritici IPO323]EGP82418.1 hypothetical protein MYCGRDRAFT_83119 [Zymoseptoria tritici IPO323]SMR64747.1 unnamed protein product [Zymoseptoria tritici ST99CH_3D1]SMY30138.1 unnamed protein product [Zymoseptoria tritici ST99CH_1A5]